MSRKRVIVKRLNSIQNFGAMDVLCTDKTGTLTQDRIILKRHLDIAGDDSDRVLDYAYLNSHYQSGVKNLLDAGSPALPQLAQAGEPLQECLTLLFQVRVIGKRLFHIVVIILQYKRQKQAKTLEPTFISSTLPPTLAWRGPQLLLLSLANIDY
jgi:magnesium-transporting ATPase (P-type)